MKKALNQYGKLVDIIESTKSDTYICPVCKENLIRNFGEKAQYFSHSKGMGDGCELKLKLIIKDDKMILPEEAVDILNNEFFNKTFSNVQIELSDYMSDEGYYLTKEQKDIIFSVEDRIKISALAGSAKTSTLYYYAKERPFKKILYLVYNKAMKDEAEKTFGKLRHVTIKTIHGLAFGYVGNFYKHKLTFNYGVVDIIKDLNLNWNNDMELAVKINKMMNEYMLSDVMDFEDIDLFKDINNKSNDERDLIIHYCKKLWQLKKEYKNNIKVEHDFYLKLFQLAKKDLSHKFDIILLDEAQDSSTLVLDIIKSSNVNGIVIVGDRFQQLYSWRKATNIMPLFDGKEYKLTTSFRVSQNIANIANLIIEDISKNKIDMKGFNIRQKIINEINKDEPYICLCRTNAYIFAEVFEVISKNKNAKLYFEGGYSSYSFQNVKDAYYFSKGYKVKNHLFNKFDDYYQMIEYANEVKDLDLIALNKMVDKYGDLIPKVIDGIKNNTVKDKDRADVLFSTIHRSKGQSYSIPVFVSDDHFDIETIFRKEYIKNDNDQENFNINDYYEEMCIVYVAISRCAGEIELSDKIKDYLLLRYEHFKED